MQRLRRSLKHDDNPDKVERELFSLEPSAVIELFQLHLTAAVNGVNLVYYYHAGTNEVTSDIVFNGVTYSAVPIEVDGQVTTKGTLPRPRMKVANADGAISAILNVYNPLQAEVRRIRTCKNCAMLSIRFQVDKPNSRPDRNFWQWL